MGQSACAEGVAKLNRAGEVLEIQKVADRLSGDLISFSISISISSLLLSPSSHSLRWLTPCQPFADVCVDLKNKTEAMKYIPKLATAELRVDYFLKIGYYN